MASGLQVWDANGDVVVDTTTRLGRIVGVTTINSASGSINDADFADGTPFWIATPSDNTSPTFGPKFTFSGTTLSWNFEGRTVSSHRLIYGVF